MLKNGFEGGVGIVILECCSSGVIMRIYRLSELVPRLGPSKGQKDLSKS